MSHPDARITVDFSAASSPVTKALRPSFNLGSGAELKVIADFPVRGLNQTSVEGQMDASTSLDDYETADHSSGRLKTFVDVQAQRWIGDTLIIFGRMPTWLSTRAGDETQIPGGWTRRQASKPTNLSTWRELVRRTADYIYNVKGLTNAIMCIWQEPNTTNFWLDSFQDYVDLYKYAADGAKAAYSNMRIAGPEQSNWEDVLEGFADTPAFAQEFMNTLASSTLPVLGGPVPLTMFSYHSFGQSTSRFDRGVSTIRGWLNAAGLQSSLLCITSWNITGAGSEPLVDQDFNAAYCLDTYRSLSTLGVDQHVYFRDIDYPDTLEFYGNFGLLTKPNVIQKPGYNAHLMLAQLAANLVPISTTVRGGDGDYKTLDGLASFQAGKVVVVCWRHLNPATSGFGNEMIAAGYTPTYFTGRGITIVTLKAAITAPSHDLINGLNLTAADKTFLGNINDRYHLRLALDRPMEVDWELKGLPIVPYRMERFEISEYESNSETGYSQAKAAGATEAQAVSYAQQKQELTRVQDQIMHGNDLKPIVMNQRSCHLIRMTPVSGGLTAFGR